MNQFTSPLLSKPWTKPLIFLVLLIGSFGYVPVGSAVAAEPTVEEKAALLLFKEGKALYKGGRYEEALKRFENASRVVKKEVLTFYLGQTYARLGRCEHALLHLSPLAGKVPREAEQLRIRDETRCLQAEAKRLVADDDCVGAFPHLQKLSGRLSPKDEAWRQEKERYCGPRSTAFPTDTTRSKAAHQIFLEARKSRDINDLKRAVELYEKANSLADEMVIREESFDVLVRLGRWSEATAVVKPLAEIWFHSDGQDLSFQTWWLREQVCSDYPPKVSVEGNDATKYVAELSQLLRADLGALDAGQVRTMEKLLLTGQSTNLMERWLDALAKAKSCPRYLSVREDLRFRRILPIQHRSPDVNCAPVVAGGTKSVGIREPRSGSKPGMWRSTLGWSLVTSAVLFAGGGGYFAYSMTNDISHMKSFVDEYNELSDLAKITSFGTSLVVEAEGAQDRAQGNRDLSLILGGAAVVTLSVGIYFLVGGSPKKSSQDVHGGGEISTIRWMPMIGPTGGGILGRF